MEIPVGAYSIEDAKLKSGEDFKRRAAEDLKERVRETVRALRRDYKAAVTLNDALPDDVSTGCTCRRIQCALVACYCDALSH